MDEQRDMVMLAHGETSGEIDRGARKDATGAISLQQSCEHVWLAGYPRVGET